MNEERLTELDETVTEARDQLAEIDERLAEIGDVIEASQAHTAAKDKDARDQLAAGDDRQVVIETPPGESGPDAVAHIDGIVTFVKPGGLELAPATTAMVKITDVGDSQAHAIATEIVD